MSIENDRRFKLGKILGYPECCIRNFFDRKLKRELLIEENRLNGDFKYVPGIYTTYQYFSNKLIISGFAPCHKCSVDIINGKYTHIHELIDMDIRKKHYEEVLKGKHIYTEENIREYYTDLDIAVRGPRYMKDLIKNREIFLLKSLSQTFEDNYIDFNLYKGKTLEELEVIKEDIIREETQEREETKLKRIKYRLHRIINLRFYTEDRFFRILKCNIFRKNREFTQKKIF